MPHRPSCGRTADRRLRTFLVLFAAAGALVSAGCSDRAIVQPAAQHAGASGTFTRGDSIAVGFFAAHPSLLSPPPSGLMHPSGALHTDISGEPLTIVSASPGYVQGASQPGTITLTLSGPVGSVTVVGQGAIECSGNYGELIAYDAYGRVLAKSPLTLIDPSDCSPSWNPDNVTYGAQGTVSVALGIIAKVEITPMSPLYLNIGGGAIQTYAVSLAPGTPAPCFPSGDSILDSRVVVSDMVAGLKASNPDATPGTGVKKEQGGTIFKRPDGTYFTVPALDPNATECHYDAAKVLVAVPPANEPGAVVVAIYHTHPSSTGEDTYGCTGKGMKQAQKLGDGLPIPTASPNTNGGGSDADWDGTMGYPSYTINKDGSIWRLDPNTPKGDRAKNTNRHDWKSANPGCVLP